jgi:Ni,Fe-hydrogenase I small subunit
MSDTANNDVAATVNAIDEQLAHLWMVRTFIKHSDEAVDDEELRDIARELYDFILAVAPAKQAEDDEAYLKMAKKKFSKLKSAAQLFVDIQPDVSSHTNFEMAAKSLSLTVEKISSLLQA